MSDTRDDLMRYAEGGVLAADALAAGLRLAGATPDAADWRRFLDRLLLIGGALLVAVAVIFFVAFNWQDLGRFAKFAMLETLVLLPAAYAWFTGVETTKGRAALLFAILVEGGLLALLGQTYQTGADNYELFLAWALLALPWVLAGYWAPLWALWWTLINLALALFLYQALDPLRLLLFSHAQSAAIAVLNLAGLAICEWAHAKRALPHIRWLVRYCVLLLLASAGWDALLFVLGERSDQHGAGFALYCAAIAAGAWFYQFRHRDLFPLAFGVLSLIVVVTAFLGRHMLFGRDAFGGFFVLAALVIGATAAATWWLRELNRKWHGEAA